MAVSPIPAGYHSVTPYLIVHDGVGALDFYKKALDAVELMRMPGPNGKIMHAEFKVGDCPIMLADEFTEMGFRSPKSLGGSSTGLMVYVPDVDKQFKQAIAAGGKEMRPIENQFYGDRSGTLIDPFGHMWTISTHIEDVPCEEMEAREKAAKAAKG